MELSTAAWRTIMSMFTSQSRARIAHLHSKLCSTRKGEQTSSAYYAQTPSISMQMPHYMAAEVEAVVAPCEAATMEDFEVAREATAMATRSLARCVAKQVIWFYTATSVSTCTTMAKRSMPTPPQLGTMLIRSGTPTRVPLITSPPSLTS
jgi:hypothetical protein